MVVFGGFNIISKNMYYIVTFEKPFRIDSFSIQNEVQSYIRVNDIDLDIETIILPLQCVKGYRIKITSSREDFKRIACIHAIGVHAFGVLEPIPLQL